MPCTHVHIPCMPHACVHVAACTSEYTYIYICKFHIRIHVTVHAYTYTHVPYMHTRTHMYHTFLHSSPSFPLVHAFNREGSWNLSRYVAVNCHKVLLPTADHLTAQSTRCDHFQGFYVTAAHAPLHESALDSPKSHYSASSEGHPRRHSIQICKNACPEGMRAILTYTRETG